MHPLNINKSYKDLNERPNNGSNDGPNEDSNKTSNGRPNDGADDRYSHRILNLTSYTIYILNWTVDSSSFMRS